MRKILAVCFFVPALYAQTSPVDPIRSAAGHAVAMVQMGATGFYKTMDCFSCHGHGQSMLVFRMAREHGIRIDEDAASHVAAKGLLANPHLASIDRAVQDTTIIDPVLQDGWALIAADAAGLKPNLVTAVYARRIANWQRADGHWPSFDERPPQAYSLFTATAVGVRTTKLFLPERFREETGERLARARKWLLTAEPQNTEDATFRLFGLHWAG